MTETDNKARIAELEARIKVLETRANPPPRPPQPARLEGLSPSTYRLLDQMSIPKHVFDEFVANVDPEVIKQLRTDGKR
jgi:hypothetical protein